MITLKHPAFSAPASRGTTYLCVLCVLCSSISVVQAAAPPDVSVHRDGPRQRAESEETQRARLLGLLVYTRISVKFEETPARDAVKAIRDVTGLDLIGRWSDDALALGIDPATPITIDAREQPAVAVIEELLEQCEGLDECTWQLRRGFVELGTKQRLSVPGARETRTYNIRDFMLEPPTFATTPPPEDDPNNPYTSAALGAALKSTSVGARRYEMRKAPRDLALEILRAVVETVEPGHWDFGQPVDDDPEAPATAPASTPAGPMPSGPVAHPAAGVDPLTYWASIRLWRDQLIVRAPDFIHRQIGGYPKPIPPEADPDETADERR